MIFPAWADLLDSSGLLCHQQDSRLIPTHIGIDLIQHSLNHQSLNDLERIKKKKKDRVIGGQVVNRIQSWPFLGHAQSGCSLSLLRWLSILFQIFKAFPFLNRR